MTFSSPTPVTLSICTCTCIDFKSPDYDYTPLGTSVGPPWHREWDSVTLAWLGLSTTGTLLVQTFSDLLQYNMSPPPPRMTPCLHSVSRIHNPSVELEPGLLIFITLNPNRRSVVHVVQDLPTGDRSLYSTCRGKTTGPFRKTTEAGVTRFRRTSDLKCVWGTVRTGLRTEETEGHENVL